jgi:hypothetical protein
MKRTEIYADNSHIDPDLKQNERVIGGEKED